MIDDLEKELAVRDENRDEELAENFEQIPEQRLRIFKNLGNGIDRVAPYKYTGEQTSCLCCFETFKVGELLRIYRCEHQLHTHCANIWAEVCL